MATGNDEPPIMQWHQIVAPLLKEELDDPITLVHPGSTRLERSLPALPPLTMRLPSGLIATTFTGLV